MSKSGFLALVSLILLSLLFVGLGRYTSVKPEALSSESAFAEACRLSRYNCLDLRPPSVRGTVYAQRENSYGFYTGGNTIWLDPTLDSEARYIVMVHETVHYLQEKVDGSRFPINQLRSCLSEEEAFEVSDQVAKRLKRGRLVRAGDIRSYGCGWATGHDPEGRKVHKKKKKKPKPKLKQGG
jgi:hypothetical protein